MAERLFTSEEVLEMIANESDSESEFDVSNDINMSVMRPGIRVVRGPDWCHGNQDGGVGFLGTVVRCFDSNTVEVTWDVGGKTVCRAGSDDAFDLRVFDNRQIGISHRGFTCDVCVDTVYGIRWKCLVCDDHNECTDCYMGIRTSVSHDHTHPFIRLTTKAATVARVPPRSNSKLTPIYGIFPGAKVTKVEQNSLHTELPIGVVREIVNIQDVTNHKSYRGAASVEWSEKAGGGKLSNGIHVYRLGADGKVELRLLEPANPGNFYMDHLPVLDMRNGGDYEDVQEGDTVQVSLNLDTFKSLQRKYGGWVDDLEKVLGEEGKVTLAEEHTPLAKVRFARINKEFMIYTNALTKVIKPGITTGTRPLLKPGDVVRVTDDRDAMKQLQAGHGGLHQAYTSILGKTGHVIQVYESKDALVDIGGSAFVLNPDCLQIVGESGQNNKQIEPCSNPKPNDSRHRDLSFPSVPVSGKRTTTPGVWVDVGVRVVRGPDWSSDFENQDGGEGHLGSLVEVCGLAEDDMYPRDCVVIQWDSGERNVYRVGYEKAFDLRVYDNAGLGIKHEIPCTECSTNNVMGLLWTCNQCPDVALCTNCYGDDKHEINHVFTRHDYPGDQGVQVPRRAMSRKVVAMGIFEKSKVQRGPDWRWQNQDGGDGKFGEVIAIVNFSPETDHNAAEVTWSNGYTNVYRLGYNGRHDLKCAKPVRGGFYYRDHIPILKLDKTNGKDKPEVGKDKPEVKKEVQSAKSPPDEAKPVPGPDPSKAPDVPEKRQDESTKGSDKEAVVKNRFEKGDRVKIEIDVDILKMIEENRKAWRPEMTDCIGKTGEVLVSNGADVTVDFSDVGRWTFHESVLNKVKEFRQGDVVKVEGTVNHVRMLQTERGGWNDMIVKVIGRRGRVEDVDEDGDVNVSFGGYTWAFNPECLVESEGEPELIDCTEEELDAESTPEDIGSMMGGSISSQSGKTSEEQKFEEFFGTILAGESERIQRIIQRDPQLMLMEYKGQFAIHKAAQSGNTAIVAILFDGAGAESQLETRDPEGNTPLLLAVQEGHVEMVQYLVDAGCEKNVANTDSGSAVHIAVSKEDLPMLRKLRDLDFDINMQNALQQTPLFDAIAGDNVDILTTILEWRDLDVRSADSIGFTPFASACRKGDKWAVLGILKACPTELNRQKDDGFTGLHVAVHNNKIDIVQTLLSQPGIELNLVSKAGQTPLHIACEKGDGIIVRLLVGKGADVSLVDGSGKTCLHLWALSVNGPESTGDRPTFFNLLKLMLENGAPLDKRDKSGKLAVDYVPSEFKNDFPYINEQKVTPKTSLDRPRGSSVDEPPKTPAGSRDQDVDEPPKSLPANFGSASKQDVPAGPASMTIPNSGQPGATPTPSARNQGDIDPELCESCDEEPIRFRLEPCRHLVCADCRPAKKAKKKLCSFCEEHVTQVVEFDPR